jgi:hypothetical protein
MQLDITSFLRFKLNSFSVDEALAVFYPQLYRVDDRNLSMENFPGMLNLVRQSLSSDGLFLVYNTMNVFLWVGTQLDSFYVKELFKVDA